jgi:ABC-2 type transport system ATP-binding protein
MGQIDGALEEVGLIEVGDRKVAAFSRGMRQRLHIAIGMISQPQVLLLDEPTVGLDPIEAARLREATASLRKRGVSILLTSHYLVDVELLADRVFMLEGGHVTHVMSVGEFSASVGYAAIVVVRGTGIPPDTASLDRMENAVTQVEHSGGNWKVSLRLRAWTPQVFSDLSEILGGTHVSDVEVLPARLDDAFVRLQTGISR